MVIYLYGPDSYRRGKCLTDIREKYAAKHSAFSLYEFDPSTPANGASGVRGATDGLRELQDLCGAQSLFASKKFITLYHPFPLPPAEEKQYKKFLEGLVEQPDIVLAIVAEAAPPKAFAFLLQQAKPVKEFPMPEGAAFERFIREEASLCGARLTPALLRELAAGFAGDTWGLVAELQKVALGGVHVGVPSNAARDFFGALMALQHGTASRGLPILERLLQSEDPAKLFNVLASRVAPHEKIRFADYDVAIKTGKTDYALALTDYVLGN